MHEAKRLKDMIDTTEVQEAPRHRPEIRTVAGLIEHNEGRRVWAYDDATGQTIVPGCTVKGNVTVGVGHKGALPDHVIDALRDADILSAVSDLGALLGEHVPPAHSPRWCALVDMAFSLGRTRLRGFAKMLAAVRGADWERAADEALDSKWARQVGPRAQLDAAMLRTGEFPIRV